MGLKNLFFETDDNAKKPEKQPDYTRTEPPPKAVPAPIDLGGESDIYEQLLAKTDYANTPVGEVVAKYLKALEGLPLDAGLKLKTAIAQAIKLDGVEPSGIVGSFDAVEGWLGAQEEELQAAMQHGTATEVTERQQRIDELTAEINTKQQALAQLQAELIEARAHIQKMAALCEHAVARRKDELNKQRQLYAAAMQG